MTKAHTYTVGGEEIAVPAGAWLVYGVGVAAGAPLAMIPAQVFPGPYEVVQEGLLSLTRQERDQIEQTTGLGTTRTAADLQHAVERLARIRIGDVQVPFTPGQLEELAHRAEKRGQTVQQAIQQVVDRIRDEIFWKA